MGAIGGAAPQFDDKRFNLQVWMRGDIRTYQDLAGTVPANDGQVVRLWKDLSGNNYHVSENSANHQRVAAGSNGLNQPHVVNNIGGTGRLRLASGRTDFLSLPPTVSKTYYLRYSTPTNNDQNFLLVKDGPPDGGWNVWSRQNGANSRIFYAVYGPGATTGYEVNGGSFPVNTSVEVWIGDAATGVGAGVSFRFNRVDTAPSSINNIGALPVFTNTGIFTVFGDQNSDANGVHLEEFAIWRGMDAYNNRVAFEDSYLSIRNP